MNRLLPASLQLTLLMLLNCVLAEAMPVPVNGGFERAEDYAPIGWHTEGPWRVVGNQRYEGRRSVALNAWETLEGDRLESLSGVVIRPGHDVAVSGYYRGSGLGVCIQLVDLLGSVTASVASAALSDAEDWAEFALSWQAPAEWPEDKFAYAQVCLLALCDGAEGAFDEVRFDEDGAAAVGRQATSTPSAAETDTSDEKPPIPPPPPNLVINPGLAGGERPRDWHSSGQQEQTSWQAGRGGQAGRLGLSGGVEPAGWHGSVDRMDLSVPHRLSLRADLSDAQNGRAHAVVVLTDPTGRKMCRHLVVPVLDGGRIEAVVDAVNKLPMSGRGQISLVVPAELDGEVSFTDLALRPDPHLPTVTARQPFSIFPNPAQVSLFVQVPNHIDQITELLVHLRVSDRDGNAVSYEKRQMGVAPRAVALFPAGGRLKYNGSYTLVMRVETSDGSRTLAYGEYPFVVAPARPDMPKNPHVGVILAGDHVREITAAATAGVGWVALPVDYATDCQSRVVRHRLRTVRQLASQAQSHDLRLAVQVRLPDEGLPEVAEFAAFFRQLDLALGRNAAAYVLELGRQAMAADDCADRVANLIAAMEQVQTASWSAPVSMIVTPQGVPGMLGVGDDVQSGLVGMVPVGLPVGALGGAVTAAIAGDVQIADGLPIAVEGDSAEVIAHASAAPAVIVPHPQPSYDAVGPDGGRESWLFAVTAKQARDAGPPRLDLDALMVRAALAGFCEGHQVVFWDATAEAGLLDARHVATPTWTALWAMCRQLEGKSFVAQEPTDDDIVCLRFSGPEGDTLVMWATDGEHEVTISGDLGDGTKVNIGGQSWPLGAVAGRLRRAVTEEPLYVHLPQGAEVALSVR